MTNKQKFTLIITTVLCLLPIIMSAAVYNDLPEQIAVHWNSAGSADNYLPKGMVAFGLPVLFALLHMISKMRLLHNPKHAAVPKAMTTIYLWMIPFLSALSIPAVLCIAMDMSIPISIIVPVLVGLLLIVLGNYLPKIRQNFALGIKLPWTLHSTENWNKTHRLAGYVYILGGVLLIALTFVSFETAIWQVMMVSIVFLLVAFPVLYSFLLYRKAGLSIDN